MPNMKKLMEKIKKLNKPLIIVVGLVITLGIMGLIYQQTRAVGITKYARAAGGNWSANEHS